MRWIGTNRSRYITGFDGLRAIAVIGVIIFHLWPTYLPGGWMGVPLFFVLSGYLITDQLVQEYDRNGHIKLLSFYLRRIKRLYPALLMMLLATSTYIALFARDLLYNLRAILASNMLYIYNIWATKHGESYFDSWGGASPFTHLWSLSLEGQFYLIWPIIVMILLKQPIRRRHLGVGLIGLAGTSAVLLGVMYDPININRAYYGSDTRVFAILLGSALAFFWPSNRMRYNLPKPAKWHLNIWGILSFALTLLILFQLNGQWAITYKGLMFAATVVVTMLVAITAHPASFLSHTLDNSFLNYLGARSYSIYLYQLPVFIFFDRIVPKHTTLDSNVLKLAIVLILAELSYRYIENVFRKIKKPIAAVHPRQRFFEIRSVQLTMVVAMMLMVGTDYAISANATEHAKPTNNLEKRLNNNKSRIDQANKKAVATVKQTKQKTASQSSNAQSSNQSNQLALSQQDHDLMTKYQLDTNQFSAIHNQPVTAVGDSVMVDIAPSLQNLMPKTVSNAQVGRQAYAVPDILQSYKDQNILSQNIVISIGTNGQINPNDLNQIMNIAGNGRQVYWINGFADRDWITPNNTLLANQAKKYSNLHIVDWASLVQKHSDWLSDDQVHPNPTGSSQYASLIAKTIASQNQ